MFVSLWVPPPCLAKLSVPNSYNHNIPHPHHCNFISVCTAAGCLYYLYMFILTLFPVRLLLLFFRICILSQYKIFILILFSVEFFEIIWLIFEKSLFLSYILRSDNIYNLCQLHFYKFWAAIFGSKKDIKKASDINNSQFIMQINNERPDSSNDLRKRYVVYITEM